MDGDAEPLDPEPTGDLARVLLLEILLPRRNDQQDGAEPHLFAEGVVGDAVQETSDACCAVLRAAGVDDVEEGAASRDLGRARAAGPFTQERYHCRTGFWRVS